MIDEQDFHEFYTRWNVPVYSFCRMYLGDEPTAELATQNAFVEYVRARKPLATDRLPRDLMRLAVQESTRLDQRDLRFPDTEELDDVLPLLEPPDRAVFILRSALELSPVEVSGILNLSPERVHESWLKASLFLRDFWLRKT